MKGIQENTQYDEKNKLLSKYFTKYYLPKISSIDNFFHALFSSSINIRIKISLRYRYNLIDLIDPQSIIHILLLVNIINIIIDFKIYIIDWIEKNSTIVILIFFISILSSHNNTIAMLFISIASDKSSAPSLLLDSNNQTENIYADSYVYKRNLRSGT